MALLPPDNQDHDYLDTLHIFSAVAQTEPGLRALRKIAKICGWNKPTMTMEDAARRDVWHSLRRYIPAEKLAEIELFDLQQQQEAMLENIMADLETDLPL